MRRIYVAWGLAALLLVLLAIAVTNRGVSKPDDPYYAEVTAIADPPWSPPRGRRCGLIDLAAARAGSPPRFVLWAGPPPQFAAVSTTAAIVAAATAGAADDATESVGSSRRNSSRVCPNAAAPSRRAMSRPSRPGPPPQQQLTA